MSAGAPHGIIVRVESLNLADTFVLFLALAGPQKVLLSFARLGHVLDVRSLRLVAWTCSLAALVNLIFAWVLAPVLARAHVIVLDVLSRLLGVLLAAVGAQLSCKGSRLWGYCPAAADTELFRN